MILGTSLAAGGINDDWSHEGNRRGPDSGSCAKPSGTSRRVSAMPGSFWPTSAFKLGLRGALPYVDTVSKKNPEKQLSVSVCVVSCKVCELVAPSLCDRRFAARRVR